MPDRDEIQRIAAAMNQVRPDWRTSSLVTFLTTHHANRAYRDLLIAGVAVASDPKTQTPHLLNGHGAWWAAAQAATGTGTMTAIPGPHDTHCAVYGHEGYRLPCAGCRSEALAAPPAEVAAAPELRPNALTELRTRLHTDRTPDAKELAAGDTRDED